MYIQFLMQQKETANTSSKHTNQILYYYAVTYSLDVMKVPSCLAQKESTLTVFVVERK